MQPTFCRTDILLSERIRKLDQHQGFVKGVCWDPVGEFLATQSDDRTVKIWKTTDWSLEAEVTKPFEDSPGSTFFRRLRYAVACLGYPQLKRLLVGLRMALTLLRPTLRTIKDTCLLPQLLTGIHGHLR